MHDASLLDYFPVHMKDVGAIASHGGAITSHGGAITSHDVTVIHVTAEMGTQVWEVMKALLQVRTCLAVLFPAFHLELQEGTHGSEQLHDGTAPA